MTEPDQLKADLDYSHSMLRQTLEDLEKMKEDFGYAHKILNEKMAEIEIQNGQLEKLGADFALLQNTLDDRSKQFEQLAAESNSAAAEQSGLLEKLNAELHYTHQVLNERDGQLEKLTADLDYVHQVLNQKSNELDEAKKDSEMTAAELTAIKNRRWWDPVASLFRSNTQ